MTPSDKWSNAPAICLAIAAILGMGEPSARAQYARSGELEWSYQDAAVRTPDGTRHFSSWNEAYNLSIFGPLGHELIGEGTEAISFNRGHTVSQLAASGNSSQKILGYSFAWSLLPELVRRFLRVDPSFARTRTELVWGQPSQFRPLVDTNRSLNLGLSLPSLPTLNVRRSLYVRQDQSDAPIIDQRTWQKTEESNYVHGPFNMRYRHDRSEMEDHLISGVKSFSDQTHGEANLVLYGFKRGLESGFFRTTYEGQDSGTGYQSFHSQTVHENAMVKTRPWLTGPWQSYASISEEFSRSFTVSGNQEQGALALSSLRAVGAGRLLNNISYSRSAGFSEGQNTSDSLSFDHPVARAAYHSVGTAGLAQILGSSSILRDSFIQRLSFPILRRQSAYVEQSTFGSSVLSGPPGGQRSHSGAAGADLSYNSSLSVSSNYRATRSLDLATGLHRTDQTLSDAARFFPYAGLTGILSHNLNWAQAPGSSVRTQYLTGEMDYVLGGFSLSTGFSTTFRYSYDAFAGAKYSIGKTSLEVRGDRKGLSSPTPYWFWSALLRRTL